MSSEVLRKLLFNLQTIASIPKGKRISTAKEFIIIDEDSMIQGFWRWKNADTRDKATAAICREVRTTIAFGKFITESYHLFTEEITDTSGDTYDVAVSSNKPASLRAERVDLLKKIKSGLLGASIGIDNICQTYEDDASISGYLKPLISEINDCITLITHRLIAVGVTEII